MGYNDYIQRSKNNMAMELDKFLERFTVSHPSSTAVKKVYSVMYNPGGNNDWCLHLCVTHDHWRHRDKGTQRDTKGIDTNTVLLFIAHRLLWQLLCFLIYCCYNTRQAAPPHRGAESHWPLPHILMPVNWNMANEKWRAVVKDTQQLQHPAAEFW